MEGGSRWSKSSCFNLSQLNHFVWTVDSLVRLLGTKGKRQWESEREVPPQWIHLKNDKNPNKCLLAHSRHNNFSNNITRSTLYLSNPYFSVFSWKYLYHCSTSSAKHHRNVNKKCEQIDDNIAEAFEWSAEKDEEMRKKIRREEGRRLEEGLEEVIHQIWWTPLSTCWIGEIDNEGERVREWIEGWHNREIIGCLVWMEWMKEKKD